MVSTQLSTQGPSSTGKKRRVQGEGTVYFDEARGKWIGQVWLDGKRRKVSARTKTEATKALGKLKHGDVRERDVDRRLTVPALLEDWQTKALANKQRAASTVEAHRWAAERLTAELSRVKVADLDAPRIEKALSHMAAEGLSRASLIKVRGTLRQALDWAVRRRLVTHNAAAIAELPNGAKAPRDRKALTRDELDRLLEILDGHPWRAMYALSARVGLRPGEAAGVCADAVDLDATPPTVAVIRAVHRVRERPVLGEQLKTRGARRTLAIPADVAAMLAPMLDTEGLLFTSTTGGPVWAATAAVELAKACEKAGVPVVAPNELRHSAATHMADRGVAPHVVADVLGHTSTAMLEQVYRHRPRVIVGAE